MKQRKGGKGWLAETKRKGWERDGEKEMEGKVKEEGKLKMGLG
jgi:hypothetical protein